MNSASDFRNLLTDCAFSRHWKTLHDDSWQYPHIKRHSFDTERVTTWLEKELILLISVCQVVDAFTIEYSMFFSLTRVERRDRTVDSEL